MPGVEFALKLKGKRPQLSHYPRNLEVVQGVDLLALKPEQGCHQHFVAVDLQEHLELPALLRQTGVYYFYNQQVHHQ